VVIKVAGYGKDATLYSSEQSHSTSITIAEVKILGSRHKFMWAPPLLVSIVPELYAEMSEVFFTNRINIPKFFLLIKLKPFLRIREIQNIIGRQQPSVIQCC